MSVTNSIQCMVTYTVTKYINSYECGYVWMFFCNNVVTEYMNTLMLCI